MKKLNFLPIVLLFFIVFIFFRPLFLQGKLPIPSDTIIGLYHPFRDLYSKEYPNGIPFKNFLITDPVRQQFPWRELAISMLKRFELPLWNPYSFSGTPLLANIQSAAFYPLNALFFLFPFDISWGILIVLELLLGGFFLYLYLNNLNLNKWASLLGPVAFAFSGFSIVWMEWGTVLHVGLWLPLILLSVDKIFFRLEPSVNSKVNPRFNRGQKSKLQLKNKNLMLWSLVFVFSLTSSFFAGHLQIFFYVFIFALVYFFTRWFQYGKIFDILLVFLIFTILFFILTSVQWIPTLQLILYSARDIDQATWQREGWFIPWQHIIQFIAPDFFGSPTTLNYWGTWNYGELVGYVGIAPFIMATFSLFFRHDKKTLFYGSFFFISIILSLPTIFAKLPYILNIPFLSSTQPTRLLFITDFSLAVLAALGFDYFIKSKKREIFYPVIFIAINFFLLWGFVFFGNNLMKLISSENLSVTKNNLIFPTLIFFVLGILIVLFMMFHKTKIFTLIQYCIIVLTIFDLLRFGFKFTPFAKKEYLFPQTEALSFLQKNLGYSRFMTTDSRILPPNFSMMYRLQSVDGYDPLYLRRYGELIAASERGNPNIDPPFGFNRIITPHNYNLKIIDLLGVKYILSLSDIVSPKVKKVFQEGQTRVYENRNVIPRVFFVDKTVYAKDKNEAMSVMFRDDFDPKKVAVVEESRGVNTNTHPMCTECNAKITSYSENRVVVETNTDNGGFLVLTDTFYPTWHAGIDGKETTIFRTDYNFRGINVSKGKHKIEFYITLL